MPLLGLAAVLVMGVEAVGLALLLGLADGVRSWRRRRVREGSSDPEGELGADFLVERVDWVDGSSGIVADVFAGVAGAGTPSLTDSSSTRRSVSS